MVTEIELDDISLEVVKKNIKNLHLRVCPPTGQARISAPLWMNIDAIRVFAITKLGWIRKQQQRIREQERETPRDFVDRESHDVWGKRYLLQVIELEAAPRVRVEHSTLLLQIRPGTDHERIEAIVAEWYRHLLKENAPALIAKWEPIMSVRVNKLFVRRMKTRWGSCNTKARSIRLNSELAKKPPECLEYVVVHEMTHLLERRHNDRFKALMDNFMPQWRHYQKVLNRTPLAHDEWGY